MSALRTPLVLAALCFPLFAATLPPTPKDASLVIYNSGIGLVHEERPLSLKKGEKTLVCPGIATTVQTDSVRVSLPDSVKLYSQQYRFDKITLGKILEAHIGKTVRYKTGSKGVKNIAEGTLMATHPAVLKTTRGIESGIADEAFIFETIPPSLIMKPSLVWNIDTSKKVSGELSLDYLISGIRWKSDYTLKLDGDKGDLTGWISVDNRSGKRFEALRLHLLAGEINRVMPPVAYRKSFDMAASVHEAVEQKGVEGYHLYSIPFRVTLADNEKTQIKFIARPAHALMRRYTVTMLPPFETGPERKQPVSQFVELSAFDVPLPGGTVRTYAKTDGTTILLGESRLENTPKNEKITLRLGTNFDLVAKNRLIRRSGDNHHRDAEIEYTLINHSDAPKTVKVLIPGIPENSAYHTAIESKQPFTREDGMTAAFTIMLGVGETKTWQARFQARKK